MALTLQELTTRLQVLCHDGFSQYEISFRQKELGPIPLNELELHLKSNTLKDIYVKLDRLSDK